jgi:putative cell wall-binding protein
MMEGSVLMPTLTRARVLLAGFISLFIPLTMIAPSIAYADEHTEIVLDTDQATLQGKWTHSTTRSNYFGPDYAYTAASPERSTATWSTRVESDGEYGVYYWLPDGSADLSTAAPFTVHDPRQQRHYLVNETHTPGGGWTLLGNQHFQANDQVSIVTSSTPQAAILIDAVRIGTPGQVPPQQLVDTAILNGDLTVRIPAGEYRLDSPLRVTGGNKLNIDATGATFVMTKAATAIVIRNGVDVTLTGATINYDPLPFTQGRVTAIADDLAWFDVELTDGYPTVAYQRVEVYDTAARFQKPGVPHLWGAKVTLEGRTLRTAQPNVARNVAVGDTATFSGGNAHALLNVESTRTTLSRVTINAAPGMGFIDVSGEGGTTIDQLSITPGPPPPGATEPPMLSTNWDAVAIQGVKHGPVMKNSYIRNAGDDSFSIQSYAFPVLSTEGNTALVAFEGIYHIGKPGDRLQRFRDQTPARITQLRPTRLIDETLDPDIAAKIGTGGMWSFDDQVLYRVTFDTDSLPFKAGDPIYNIDQSGNGFQFTDNVVHSAYRGILLKASDGLIEDNTFRGADKAIIVSPESTYDSHAGTAANVTIRNNTFETTGYQYANWNGSQAGSIGFSGENVVSRPAFENFEIASNRFDRIAGLNLNISDSSNVSIHDNSFQRPHQVEPGFNAAQAKIPSRSVLVIKASTNVTVSGNVIDRIGPYSTQQVSVWPDTDNVTGLPGGVHVQHATLETSPTTGYLLTNEQTQLSAQPADPGGSTVVTAPTTRSLRDAWILADADAGHVLIQSAINPELYLTAGPGNATVTLEPERAGDHLQRWTLLDVANQRAKIQNVATGQLLDGTNADTSLRQAAPTGNLAQVWRVLDVAPTFERDTPPTTGEIGEPLDYTFAATSPLPLTYTVAAGTLPQGLHLDANSGRLSGTPTQTGTFTYTAAASNTINVVHSDTHTLQIGTRPRLSGEPTHAETGKAYTFTFSIEGTPQPTVSLSGGTLPPGLALSSSGSLSGTPTQDGLFRFTITATNSLGTTNLDSGITIRASDAQPVTVRRIAGADRYETSALTSHTGWPSGASTVFLASGETFADALSAAPAAASAHAPILLTAQHAIPTSVLAEIARLKPERIIIVGGPTAVSEAVFHELTPLAHTVHRIAGADRYATSREVAAFASPGHTATAVLATGRDYPDALSAAAGVGPTAPVILIDGAADKLDQATTTTLSTLGVKQIVLIGGPNAVSQSIETSTSLSWSVNRLGGATRFETSRSVINHFFSGPHANALLATSRDFPDALAGAALAAQLDAPLALTEPACLPEQSLTQLKSLGTRDFTLLGGQDALRPELEQLPPCP